MLAKIPRIEQTVKALRALLFDGIYKPDSLEAVLIETFGDAKITDQSYATSIGAKVILPTATATAEPHLIVFTNYNGVGELREQMSMYNIRANF